MIQIEEKRSLKFFDQSEIDQFKILKRISPESSSSIYHVVEKETNKNYVLKILKSYDQDYDYDYDQENDSNPCLSLDKIRKFIKEIEIITKLNYPLLTKIVGICFNYEFQNQILGVMVLEYCQNGSLNNYIRSQKRGNFLQEWNDTKKLVCIYGIASAMKYLHTRRIIHGCLKPSNILLDSKFRPKINDFGLTKSAGYDDYEEEEDTELYMSPETISKNVFSPESDVYSFGIIVHEILTGERPNLSQQIELSEKVPQFYRNLIMRCLSNDPNQRITFHEIVNLLKSDNVFISDSVDSNEFYEFCEYLEDSEEKEKSTGKLETAIRPIDINEYKIGDILQKGPISNIYKATHIKTADVFLAKINNKEIETCDQIRIQNMNQEINIISKLNSKTILKFVGYSEKDFDNKQRPTIITEFAERFSLDQIIDRERKGFSEQVLNDTKKLIIIFGIAYGMSYLHSHNILHRDLKPSNIFVNEFFYPKIGNFGLSKVIDENSEESDFCGTLCYMSPEQLLKKVNHKPSDVYSFSLIVYELMTNQAPFIGFDRIDILMRISTGYRPKIQSNIPVCYRELIENCWSQDPSKRPTFDDIVNILETNQDFITSTVNKDEFQKYINYLKEDSKTEESNEDDKTIESSFSFISEVNENTKINKEEKLIKVENSEEADESERTGSFISDNKAEQNESEPAKYSYEEKRNEEEIKEKEIKEEPERKITNLKHDEIRKETIEERFKLPQSSLETEGNIIKLDVDDEYEEEKLRIPQSKAEPERKNKVLENKEKRKENIDERFKLPQSSLETESNIIKLDIEEEYEEKTEIETPKETTNEALVFPPSKMETEGIITRLEIDDDETESDAKYKTSAKNQSQSMLESDGIIIKLCVEEDEYDTEKETKDSKVQKRKLKRKKVEKSTTNQDNKKSKNQHVESPNDFENTKKPKKYKKVKRRRKQNDSVIKIIIKSDDEYEINVDESPSKPQDKSLNKPQDKSLNKPQDKSQNKPQDKSQNKLQDKSQNKLQDKSPNKPQDKSPNKPQDKPLNKPKNKSSSKLIELQQELKTSIMFSQSHKSLASNAKGDIPKNTEQGSKSPKKSSISHYDRNIFHTRFYPSKRPQMPTHGITSDPIKLTVTLKDIGLEGLDSQNPAKTLDIGTNEQKERKDNRSKSGFNEKPNDLQFQLISLSHESNSNIDKAKSNIEKPASLLLSTKKAQKSQTIIPTASPRRDMKRNKPNSNC